LKTLWLFFIVFLTFATYGLGMLIGTSFSGFVVGGNQAGAVHRWPHIWLVPAGIAALVLLYFVLFFKEK
jgi:hypothetical protein